MDELNLNAKQAIDYSIQQVGKALVVSTIIITISFATLITSSFTINSHLGLLTCVLVNVAIICDFTLLPAMLKLAYPSNKMCLSHKPILIK